MSEGSLYFWLFVAVLIYFLPTFATAGKERYAGVLVLNLFLGWTLVGWVVALAWAVSLPRKVAPPTVVAVTTRLCPFCAEQIQLAAIVCKHCGRDLPSAENAVNTGSP